MRTIPPVAAVAAVTVAGNDRHVRPVPVVVVTVVRAHMPGMPVYAGHADPPAVVVAKGEAAAVAAGEDECHQANKPKRAGQHG